MINCAQLRELIIKPALTDLVMLSDVAVELLVFTCATESIGGTYLKQINGPALGIYQMEPNTYNDIWQNYINNNHKLMLLMTTNFGCNRIPSEERLVYDLRFATAMCRVHYSRVSEPLPSSSDVMSMWQYYKDHYNSFRGAAEQDQAIAKYQSFIKA
jgi:hypothetical protein